METLRTVIVVLMMNALRKGSPISTILKYVPTVLLNVVRSIFRFAKSQRICYRLVRKF